MDRATHIVRRCVTAGLFLIAGMVTAPMVDAQEPGERVYKGWELRSGLLAHDYGPTTNPLPNGEGDFDINAALLFPSPGIFKYIGAPRPHIGINLALDGTSQAYTGLTWDVHLAEETKVLRNIYLTVEAGGAVHNGENLDRPDNPADPNFGEARRFLGCRVLFRVAYGIGYDINERVSAQLYTDRISNLDACSPNDGLENTGVRLGYKF